MTIGRLQIVWWRRGLNHCCNWHRFYWFPYHGCVCGVPGCPSHIVHAWLWWVWIRKPPAARAEKPQEGKEEA